MLAIGRLLLVCLLSLATASLVHADSQLRVGIALPLTGVGAPYGEAFRNGILLGLEGHSSEIELAFEDHQYDSKSAIAAARKLATVDSVDLIFVWGYGPSDTVAPIVASLKVPVILASLNPVSQKGGATLNFSGPLRDIVTPLAAYLKQNPDDSVAIVAAPIGSLEQSAKLLQAELPSSILKKYETVLPDLLDFKSVITRLKIEPPSTVGLFLTPPQIKVFIEQARAQKFSPRYIGIDTFNDSSIRELFIQESDGPVFVDAFSDPVFVKTYEKHFGGSSHVVEAARGQLLAQLLLHVSKGFKRSTDIPVAIDSFPPGQGPAGAFSIVNSDDFGRYLATRQVLYRISKGNTVQN